MVSRVILTAGKGGVGKSTVAAATAVACARTGHRTLVMSIDAAHNLADVFAVDLDHTPRLITPGLFGLEVDLNRELAEHWSSVTSFLVRIAGNDPDVSGLLAEECAVLPGMEEVFGLIRLQAEVESSNWDVIIVDTPPTGDLLKYLRLPDVLSWFLHRYQPLDRGLLRRIRPLAEKLQWPVPSDEAAGEIEYWFERVARAGQTLTDAGRSTVRLVLTPDRVSLAETRRALNWTCLLGIHVDGLVVNKIWADGTYPRTLANWRARQVELLREVEEDFSALPILQAPLAEAEVTGLPALEALAEHLFTERDPAGIWCDTPPVQWIQSPDSCVLRMRLPFLSRRQFRLLEGRDGLILLVANQRRLIPLPPAVVRRKMGRATYENGWLSVEFTG